MFIVENISLGSLPNTQTVQHDNNAHNFISHLLNTEVMLENVFKFSGMWPHRRSQSTQLDLQNILKGNPIKINVDNIFFTKQNMS